MTHQGSIFICAANDDFDNEVVSITIPSDASEGAVYCFNLQDIVFDDDVIEDTESFLVSIEQTIPPLTVQTGSTEVFIKDDDGMLRFTTKVY